MAKPKKWNEMSPAEQAEETKARASAKAERRAAEKAALEAEKAGPANKGKLAEQAKVQRSSAGSPATVPAGKVGRTVIGGNLDIPQGDTRVFDFEKAVAHEESLIRSSPDATPTEVPTQTYEQPKQKSKLAKAAKTTKAPVILAAKSTAAPAITEAHALPGQGSMADKPVEKVVQLVPEAKTTPEGIKKWKAGEAERRITQGSAPQAERRAALQAQKVITPSGAIEPVPGAAKPQASSSVAEAMRASMRSGRGAASWKVDDEVKAAYESSLKMGRRAMQSTGQKVAGTAGTAVAKGAKWAAGISGKALIGFGKGVTEPLWKPVAEFAAGHAARKAAHTAAGEASKEAAKGGLKARAAARAGQAIASARTAGAVGLMGGRLALGGAKLAGEGIAAAALWDIGAQGEKARAASATTIHQLKKSGAKQGLTVTAPEPSVWRMGLGGSPKIKVHDPSQDVDPATGKSLSQKRREQGEYVRLKKAAGRNVITGSYKGKGGSENV